MDLENIKKEAQEKFNESCDILKSFGEPRIKKVYVSSKNCLLNLCLKERVHLTNKNVKGEIYLKVVCLPGNKILLEVEETTK
jgi:hypothetical protein